jgi:hypothetical protein
MTTSHNTPTGVSGSMLRGAFNRCIVPSLSRSTTYGLMGIAIPLLDIFTSRFLQFPMDLVRGIFVAAVQD